MSNMQEVNKRQERASWTTVVLSLCILAAFCPHLFEYAFSATSYCLFVGVLIIAFVFLKPMIIFEKNMGGYCVLWLVSVLIPLSSYLVRFRSDPVLIDVGIMFCAFILILCFSSQYGDYIIAIKMIRNVALLFVAGVLLQKFFPIIYQTLINVFPSGFSAVLREQATGSNFNLSGFTINTGFTSNYIIIGIFAIIALREKQSLGKGNGILLIVSLLGLLFTGKRGPIIFMLVAIICCYLCTLNKSEKVIYSIRVFVTVTISASLLWIFQGFFYQIPFFYELFDTINGIKTGAEISSGRTKLYAWAVQLFRENPLFGIGWGRYRETVVGVATYVKELDVHNVYLQLLCETGIIGFSVFVGMFCVSWVMTKNSYKQCASIDDENLRQWRTLLFFSLVYQTYFLLYCMTGNPLYDQFHQIMYSFACSSTVAYKYAIMLDKQYIQVS